MKRNYLFSLLNSVGLSIGIATCFVVVNYIITEYSFDSFHKEKNSIYNVYYEASTLSSKYKVGITTSGIGPAMQRDLMEVNNYARIIKSSITVVNNESGYKESKVFWADASFLDIFSFPLTKGDKNVVLKEPFTVAISESTAKKYFGDEEAMGKIIKIYDLSRDLPQSDFKVVGVFKDVPYNSHIQFDILLSYKTLTGIYPNYYSEGFSGNFLYTFVKMNDKFDNVAFRSKMQDLTDKYQPTNGKPNPNNVKYCYWILPIKEYHRSEMTFMLNQIFNPDQAFFMLFLAIIVLIVGWFNYINLSNVRSMERAKEVGIRKLLGAHKINLILPFIFETLVLSSISTLLAILIVYLLKDNIKDILGISKAFYVLELPWFWGCLILFITLNSLISGLYPAFVLSSYKPLTVLKGKFTGSKRGIIVRRVLMISQFVVAIALGIGAIVIYKQIKNVINMDKNIAIDNVLVLESPQLNFNNSFDLFNNFKKEILEYPSIESVTTCNFIPGELPNDRDFIRREKGEKNSVGGQNMLVGKDFFKTFKVRILAGNDLSYYNEDQFKGKALLNRPLAKKLGYAVPEDAIGEVISISGDTCNVVGVVEGFLHNFRMEAEPISLTSLFRSDKELYKWICIRYNGKSISEVNKRVQESFTKHFPRAPYKYEILTDYYNLQFKQEARFISIFKIVTFLSIALGLIGVIGLISYILIKKSKQMGLRKVLGANNIQIMKVLYKELGYLILIANIIAWPIIYFFMKRWLQNFPCRIEQNILWYALISVFVFFIIIMSVFYQVLKVSRSNPIEVLREE